MIACFLWLEQIETATWEELAEMGQFPIMDKAIGEALEKLLHRTQKSNLKLEGASKNSQATHPGTASRSHDMAQLLHNTAQRR